MLEKMQSLESIKKLKQEKFKEFKQVHIFNEKQTLQPLFVEKYNGLKDPGWPDIKTYDDFDHLPDAIIAECKNVHLFSPDIWFKDIEADATRIYEKNLKTQELSYWADWILQYKEIFQNKKIIDLACNVGHYSFFCVAQGSKNVLGVDVRQSLIDIAKDTQEILNISHELLQFDTANLHDYAQIADLCQDRDTVLLLGVMYHVHDHVNILNAVLQPNIQHIVIEVGNTDSIFDSPEPLIHWKIESPEKHNAGNDSFGKNTIPIGYANLAWYKYIMSYFDFELLDYTTGLLYNHYSSNVEFKETRSLYVFKRK